MFYFTCDRSLKAIQVAGAGACGQVVRKYPVLYTDSMNTVLRQELIRYNRLISVVQRSLRNLARAIQVT